MVNFRWVPGWKNEVCVALTAMARGNFYRGKLPDFPSNLIAASWKSQKAFFSDSWEYLKKSCLTFSICDRQERNVGWCLDALNVKANPESNLPHSRRSSVSEAAVSAISAQLSSSLEPEVWGAFHTLRDIFNLGIWMNLTYKEGDRWGPGLTVIFSNLPKEGSFSSQGFLRPQNAVIERTFHFLLNLFWQTSKRRPPCLAKRCNQHNSLMMTYVWYTRMLG